MKSTMRLLRLHADVDAQDAVTDVYATRRQSDLEPFVVLTVMGHGDVDGLTLRFRPEVARDVAARLAAAAVEASALAEPDGGAA